MPSDSPKPHGPGNPNRQSKTARFAWYSLAAIALVYALLAGLHTLQDFDLGWQLATGRWVVQHHHFFSTDVFSYTAAGQPWIYPALSGVIFYLCFLAGGYALLSWLGAVVCAATVALLLRKDAVAASALAVISVPLIANRTQPRADMFTTLFFAAFLALLWKHYCTGRSRLWLLPVLMILWVNLHPGFVAGLALCGGYVVLELLDLAWAGQRPAAIKKLRSAWPWLAFTGVATVLNPWGPSIYLSLLRQERVQALHNYWVVEWGSIRPSWSSIHQAINWRDPQSSFWWLLIAAAISVCVALWRKQWGAAVLLVAAGYLALQHVRLQALFACIVVLVGGSLLDEPGAAGKKIRQAFKSSPQSGRLGIASLGFVVVALIAVAGIRSSDLISNRYYMRSTQLSLFGTGLSWWYPERAIDVLQREKLPAEVFNGYSMGGYITWRLFPAYRDYIDSRAVPFGLPLFFRAYDLASESPDAAAWQQEADARQINTIIVPLGRYQGMTLFPQLHAFCRSKLWSPVYLDEVSVIFVRRTPQTTSLIERLQIDCDKTSFVLPAGEADTARAKAELFNASANAGGVLYSLERYPEALADLDHAQSIFRDSGNVHFLRALVLEQMDRANEAEREFRTSLRLEPNDETWFDFGLFYMTQKRYAEAADIFRRSAETSSRPHQMWMMLGQAELQLHQPQSAMADFDKAEETNPFRDESAGLGAGFNSLIATGRAKASYQLGDLAQAVSFQEDAVKLAPNDARLWLGLADLYEAQGRTTKAAEARLHARKE